MGEGQAPQGVIRSSREQYIRGLTIESCQTHFERMLTGSSERSPAGELYTFDRALEEGFPDWVFKAPRAADTSTITINRARTQGYIDSHMLQGVDEDSMPEDGRLRLYLRALSRGESREIDFVLLNKEKALVSPQEVDRLSLEEKVKGRIKLLKPMSPTTERFRYIVQKR